MNITYFITGAIITLVVIRLVIGNTKTANFRIINWDSSFSIHKMLGIIPDKYRNRFCEQIIQKNAEFILINLTDNLMECKENYVVIRKESDEFFLKAFPLQLLDSFSKKDSVTSENYVSFQIDLKLFNYYLEVNNIIGRDSIIDRFCYFLSNPIGIDNYRFMESKDDLMPVLEQKPRAKDLDEYLTARALIEDLNTLVIDTSYGLKYVWFESLGLIRFKFTFNENGYGLTNVSSKRIGDLGNEFAHTGDLIEFTCSCYCLD